MIVNTEKLRYNWLRIQENIRKAAQKVGREDLPKVVVASKYMDVSQMRILYSFGLKAFGENRVQDLCRKRGQLQDLEIDWHFIGHLQRNKVRLLLEQGIYLLHSVDSLRLVETLSKWTERLGLILDCLIEVNISGEETKYGIREEDIGFMCESIDKVQGLRCVGLMVMAPYTSDEGIIRGIFSKARKLCEKFSLPELSMGMSCDYTIAVEEGATILRIGSAFLE